MKNLQGRLFMVVWFSVIAGIGWLYCLVMAAPDSKGAIFGTLFGVVGMIIQAYFNRQDRLQDNVSSQINKGTEK
ncbi:MAG: hypothetical protein NTV06_06275 [candidate division Zixibacteria bacterium]|nr:hypothetical protein [candidate division Zixibacteria bacterium]